MEPEQHVDINPTPKPIMTDAPSNSTSSPDSKFDVKPSASTSDVGVDTKGVEVEPPKAVEVPIKTIDEDKGKKISELQKKQQAKDVSGEPDAKIIYDNQELDPTLLAIKKSTLESATQKANLNFDETASFNPDYKGKSLDELISEELSKLEASAMDQFLIDYPEKAEKYKDDPAIQAAMERKMNAETQRDQETLRLLGYSEEEIQAEFEKHPYLLANEKITFLMLKNLRDSKDLPQDLKNELLAVYNDKLQHIFLRKINEARVDNEKVTIDQIKDADIRSLLASLEADPEMADKTAQLLQMIERVAVEKSKANQDLSAQQNLDVTPSGDGVDDKVLTEEDKEKEDDVEVGGQSQDEKKETQAKAKSLLSEMLKDAKNELSEEIKKKLEKLQKEGVIDLGDFLEFMIEGGVGGGVHSGGHAEGKKSKEAGESENLLDVSIIKEYTMEQMEAEKNLLLRGLSGAGFSDEVKLYSRMTAQEAFDNPDFQKAIFKAADNKEKEFTQGIVSTLKNDGKAYGLSSESFTYLLNIPKTRSSEKKS